MMAREKAPAFQFYPRDFLADPNVMAMDLDEVGAYVKLMSVCWTQGVIPNNPKRLARIVGADPAEFERMWEALEPCFNPSDDGANSLLHPRLEKEREAQAERRRKRAEAGRKGGKAKAEAKQESSNATAKPSPASATASAIKEPIADLWKVWVDVLGGDPPHPSLSTGKRADALRLLYTEQLANRDNPTGLFRRICEAVKRSDHHMSRREYHYPESLFRNPERREKWTLEAIKPAIVQPERKNGKPQSTGRYIPGAA